MTIAQDPTHPTGVSSDDKGGSALRRARERKAASAVDLKARGYKLEDIAVVLGYPSARHVGVAMERYLEEHLQETDKALLRQITYRRMENATRAIYDKATDPTHPDQIAAGHMLVKYVDRQAKLIGMDAPTEVIVSNPIAQEVQAWIDNAVELKRISAGDTTLQLEEADIIGEAEWSDDEVGPDEVFEPMTDEEWEAAKAGETPHAVPSD
jgi:23S rRNA pseudoU1915 N3-methylase RlmH